MLEAKLNKAATLKHILNAVKELVQDANFECNDGGISLQAMADSHLVLVVVKLHANGFERYRCDYSIPLGVNLGAFAKVLTHAKDNDMCTLKTSDNADVLSLSYEAHRSPMYLRLMDIDEELFDLPEIDYDACVTMTSAEFTRIVRNLSSIGESVRIEVSKENVRFVSDNETAQSIILLEQTDAARERYEKYDKEEEMANGEDEASDSKKKKRKRPAMSSSGSKARNNAKRVADDSGECGSGGVHIEMTQHVSLMFSVKYLVNFSKSAALSDTVQLMLKNDTPLLVSYTFGQGYIRYYLAPEFGDD